MTTREQRLRDDEPAFPIVGACADNQFNGMTLRDYFAIRCLPQWFGTGSPDSRAKAAYADADAMLKARKEPGQ